MSSICNCSLINPKDIYLFYKHISELPLYIKKLKKKECIHKSCLHLHRNYLYNYDDRYNYNRIYYYFKNKFLKLNRQKMKETFYIIKMLNQHAKKNKEDIVLYNADIDLKLDFSRRHSQENINKCNSLIYKLQFDINGDEGICIIFSPNNFKKINEYNSYDDD